MKSPGGKQADDEPHGARQVEFLGAKARPPAASAMPPGAQAAAGALVWRVRGGVLEVLLIHRPRYDDWSWPKGKVDPGESLPACAVREVEEETGKPIALGLVLPSVSYWLSNGQPKEVRYWAAQQIDAGSRAVKAREPVARASILEIDMTRWMPVDVAHQSLTRNADRRPLEGLVTAYATGRLTASQVILLRHGHARSRASWSRTSDGAEQTRPLTDAGLAQSRALVPILGAWAPQAVASSPWTRCLATITPYSEANRIKPQTTPVLSETGALNHPRRAASVMSAAIRSQTSIIICTHRPVLPLLLDALAVVADPELAAQIPNLEPYLRPGHFLVAHIARNARDNPVLVGLEHHRPDVIA